ncbi:MAG: hypothetical protein JWP11_3826, partial [Frankiales bacterium]|nr:hypothetical protein [Frankiales bacterium]
MTRTSMLGKFAPLGAIAVVQLLVILLVPSVGNKASDSLAGAGNFGAPGAPTVGAPGTAAAGTVGGTGGGVVGGAPGSA